AVDGLEQGGLATAGFAAQEGPLATPEPQLIDAQEGRGIVALMHELEVLDGQAEYRILDCAPEVRAARQAIVFGRVLYVLDGDCHFDDPAAVGPKRCDRRHDVDEPGTLVDQGVHKL